jgi:hypothetical protein
MAGSPSILELAAQYDSQRAEAETVLGIPEVIQDRIANGQDSTGSDLADFAIARSGSVSFDMIKTYTDIDQRLTAAEGEPVMVITNRSSRVKQGKITKKSLASMEGGAWMPHERDVVAQERHLPEGEKRYWLGNIAAGGPQVSSDEKASLNPDYAGMTFATSPFPPTHPWLIPTEAGFVFAWTSEAFTHHEDDLNPKHHEARSIPVYDFMSDAKRGDGFPSALGRELRSIRLTVKGHAAHWRIRELLRTDLLIGQAEITEAGMDHVQAQLLEAMPSSVAAAS